MDIEQSVLKISGVDINVINETTLHEVRGFDGVNSVEVDSGHGIISITFNTQKISADEIMNYLLDSGIIFKRYNIS